jgi:hypothetical protein
MTACLADTRCRSFVDDQPGLAGETPLCDPCLEHSSRSVPLLVHDYRDLEQLLPKSISEWSDGQPGHSGEAPIPLRLDVEALQREIWHLSTAWAEVLSDRQRLSPAPTHVRDGYAVKWAVGILAPRCEHLARIGEVQMVNYPVADEETTRFRTLTLSYVSGAVGLLDLSRAHGKARTLLGLTEPVYELPGHCQNRGCGRAELRVKDGSDTVWCDHCGSQMTRDDYDRYGNLFLREAA